MLIGLRRSVRAGSGVAIQLADCYTGTPRQNIMSNGSTAPEGPDNGELSTKAVEIKQILEPHAY
jgi:hypothetical protein